MPFAEFSNSPVEERVSSVRQGKRADVSWGARERVRADQGGFLK